MTVFLGSEILRDRQRFTYLSKYKLELSIVRGPHWKWITIGFNPISSKPSTAFS